MNVGFWLWALCLPVLGGLIGYGIHRFALVLLFYPLEKTHYFGKFLAWHGTIPSRTHSIVAFSAKSITENIVTIKEMFARMDPEVVAHLLRKHLSNKIRIIARDVLDAQQPGLWDTLPDVLRDQVIRRVQADAPTAVAEIIHDLQTQIDSIFDLEHTILAKIKTKPEILVTVFQTVAAPELFFLKKMGIYLGSFLGGLAVLFGFLSAPSVPLMLLSLLLLVVLGGVLDFLIVKNLFLPLKPIKIGPFILHGQFIARQSSVARAYAQELTAAFLDTPSLLNAVLFGPKRQVLHDIVKQHAAVLVDDQVRPILPFVTFAVGSERYESIKKAVSDELIVHLPDLLRHITNYADSALDVRATLESRFDAAPAWQVKELLHPIFAPDEPKVAFAGMGIGFVVGLLSMGLVFLA